MLNNPLQARFQANAFCGQCGGKLERRVPPGDGRERGICVRCGTIVYENPKAVVGCIATWQDKILLCRRAIEPRYGTWTLPAGFLENGETSAEGAARETREEAGAEVAGLEPFMLIDVPDVHQMHIFFTASLAAPTLAGGDESLEARLFDEAEVPWSDLSFPTVITALKQFFADRSGKVRVFRRVTIARSPRP